MFSNIITGSPPPAIYFLSSDPLPACGTLYPPSQRCSLGPNKPDLTPHPHCSLGPKSPIQPSPPTSTWSCGAVELYPPPCQRVTNPSPYFRITDPPPSASIFFQPPPLSPPFFNGIALTGFCTSIIFFRSIVTLSLR